MIINVIFIAVFIIILRKLSTLHSRLGSLEYQLANITKEKNANTSKEHAPTIILGNTTQQFTAPSYEKGEPAAACEQPPRSQERKSIVGECGPTIPQQTSATNNLVKDNVRPQKTTNIAEEKEPSFIQRFFATNLLAKVGALILLLGVLFLLKYAAELGFFPIEARLVAVAIGAIVCIGIGWHLRQDKANYAHILQGTGVAILLALVFTSFRLYHILNVEAAFGLSVAITAFTIILAILQNSLALICLGEIGGFLSPMFIGNHGGVYWELFSYYLLLDLSIIIINWFKNWTVLTILGFVFTFIIGTLWGVLNYDASFYLTCQLFLLIFFLLFIGTSILPVYKFSDSYNILDNIVLFGLPLCTFGLQLALVRPFGSYGNSLSSMAMATIYLLAGWLLIRKKELKYHTLAIMFVALGIIFTTITIPLALSYQLTAVIWSIEGLIALFIGVKSQRNSGKIFGIVLLFCASIFCLLAFNNSTSYFINALAVGISYVGSSYLLTEFTKSKENIFLWEQTVAICLLIVGLLWWYLAAVIYFNSACAIIIFVSVSSILWLVLNQILKWQAIVYPALGLLIILWLLQVNYFQAPITIPSIFAWIFAFITNYVVLFFSDKDPHLIKYTKYLHCGILWLLCWKVMHLLHRMMLVLAFQENVWHIIILAVIPAGILWILSECRKLDCWPFKVHAVIYESAASLPLMVFLYGWIAISNIYVNIDLFAFPYLPILNPFDLVTIFVIFSIVAWQMNYRCTVFHLKWPQFTKASLIILGVLVFEWLTAVVLRSIHYYFSVPYTISGLFASTIVQSTLSLFWTLIALATMIIATKISNRQTWLVGIILLGLVIAKLFLVDLANSGTIARVASFVGVGALVLLLGYLSPIPPRAISINKKE